MQIWTRALMMSAAAAALTFSSCGDKDKDTPPTTEKKEVPAVVVAPAKIAELGFISQLPSDTAVVAAIYNPNDLWQKIRGSATSRTIHKIMTMRSVDIGEGTPEPPPVSPKEEKALSIIGEEIVFAQYGDAASSAAKLFESSVKLVELVYQSSGTGSRIGSSSSDVTEEELEHLLFESAKDINVTPTIIALKNSEAAYNDIKQLFDVKLKEEAIESEGILTPITHILDGITYTGYQAKGDAIKVDESSRNAQKQEKLATALKGKTACLLLGRKGDYTVLYLGKNAEDLRYAESPEKSAAASPDLAFVGEYSTKPVFVSMVSKDILAMILDWAVKVNKAELSSLAPQIETLLDTGILQDPDDKVKNALTALTAKVAELYDFTYSTTPSPLQTYAWMDKGLNIDLILSADSATNTMNMSTPLAFSEASASPDTLLFYEINCSDNYYKVCTETIYEFGGFIQTLGEVAANSDAILEESPAIPMFSGPVLATTKTIGSAIKKALSEGLGTNTALVISAAPEDSAIPVDFAFMQTVKDKAKVQEATDEIIQAGRTLGTTFGPMWESVPALQTDTYKAGTEEMTRYSLEPSEMTQGVNPGVLLGAKTLIQGSSLPYIEKLAGQTASGTGEKKGAYVKLNIQALKKTLTPLIDDEDSLRSFNALSEDIKAIDYGVTIKDGKSKFLLRFITE